MDDRLHTLIMKYQDAAQRASSILREEYAVEDLFRAYRSSQIPREGEVRGISFRFHGSGCYFCSDQTRVDVDFGPKGRVDGFDAGRLLRFAQETLNCHELDFDQVQKLLAESLDQGELVRPGISPSSHLYYLNNSPSD